VARIDLARGSVRDVIPVGNDPLLVVFGYGALWVANSDDGTVSVIRPGVAGVETIDGISRPYGISAGEGAIWVGSNTDSTVTKIDPDTRGRIAEIDVRREPPYESGLFAVATGAGSVWALNREDRDVVRIDPRTNHVVARIALPPNVEPRSLHVARDAVWLSVGTPGFDG
jgi:DNA-binding beta-propeller fold protein YncE